MAKTFTVTAPLVIAKNEQGADLYVYQGATVPEGQSKEWLASHEESGMIVAGDVPAAEPAAPAAADPDFDGTVEEVLDYVGDDKSRAAEALAAEQAKASPRSTLVAKLEAIANS